MSEQFRTSRPRVRLAFGGVALVLGAVAMAGFAGGEERPDLDPAPTKPDLLAQLEDWDTRAAGQESDGGVAELQRQAESGYISIAIRGVLGRVPAQLFFETETADSIDDIGPVLADHSDEVVAYFAPNVGLILPGEYEALHSDEDLADLADELDARRGCPEGQDSC